VTGSVDQTTRIWSAASGEEISCREDDTDIRVVNHVAFSPDATRVAIAAAGGAPYDQPTVTVFNARTGAVQTVALGHDAPVWCVEFSPDGRLLASGGGDGRVILWNAVTGAELQRFCGHQCGVYRVAFSPDGKTMACCCIGNHALDPRHSLIYEYAETVNVGESYVRAVITTPCQRGPTTRVWDVASRICLAVHDGLCDPRAIAAGKQKYPWLAYVRQLETVVESAEGGTAMGWSPVIPHDVVTHPNGRIWAAAVGSHLQIFGLAFGDSEG